MNLTIEHAPDDFPKLTERRFVIGFGPAQAQSRLQAGAPFWLRLCCAILYRRYSRLETCATSQHGILTSSSRVYQVLPGAGLLLVLALGLGFNGTHTALGQDATPVVQTNELTQSDAVDSADDAGTTDDLESTNQVSESNSVGQAASRGPDGRTRRLQRQRRPRRITSGQNGAGLASTNGAGPLDYAAFRLITERNIFDPNRQPHTPGARPQPKAQDSITLVGTMSYEKGDFAFFDGSSTDYKKVCKPTDTIAGYKVVSISANSVKLERESKDLDLPVGSQLRHQEDGSWVKAAVAGSYTASTDTSSSSPTDTASSGADSDMLKRLMQRHEKENSP